MGTSGLTVPAIERKGRRPLCSTMRALWFWYTRGISVRTLQPLALRPSTAAEPKPAQGTGGPEAEIFCARAVEHAEGL